MTKDKINVVLKTPYWTPHKLQADVHSYFEIFPRRSHKSGRLLWFADARCLTLPKYVRPGAWQNLIPNPKRYYRMSEKEYMFMLLSEDWPDYNEFI